MSAQFTSLAVSAPRLERAGVRSYRSGMLAMLRTERSFELPYPCEQLWPILNKTDWINRAIGLPPVEYEITPQSEGGTKVMAQASFFGLKLRWEERPFEWIENDFYHAHRIYEGGPLIEAKLGLVFREHNPGRTQVLVFSELTPRNLFGAILARTLIAPKGDRDMGAVIQHVERYLEGAEPIAIPKLPVTPVAEEVMQSGLKKMAETGQPSTLVLRLEQMLREAPDVALARLRPLAIARKWGEDKWAVLHLFLHATRAGLLELSWSVLCPNCRSSRQSPATTLSDLSRTAHCDVCDIKYDAQFDRSVELTFHAAAALRRVDMQTFCLAGPGGKPHVVSQIYLSPGMRRAWQLPPLTTAHRLRSPQVKQPVILSPEGDGAPLNPPLILCEPDQFKVVTEAGGSRDSVVQVLNPNSHPVQLTLERLEWDQDILTAAMVTTCQEFRDLFSAEVVSPLEQITIGSQVILFTDLRGSTAMYNGIGDAPAYALVRNHFQVLMEVVRENHGAIVKTIGDAIMAAFCRVDDGLAAIKQMHDRLPEAAGEGRSSTKLTLKSSLHVGPCLAVNANERLDFFGTTVNLAARMIDASQGGDVILSDELYRRAETGQFLKGLNLSGELSELRFRGFEAPHKIWRVKLEVAPPNPLEKFRLPPASRPPASSNA